MVQRRSRFPTRLGDGGTGEPTQQQLTLRLAFRNSLVTVKEPLLMDGNALIATPQPSMR